MLPLSLIVLPLHNLQPSDRHLGKIMVGFRSSLLSRLAGQPDLKVYSQDYLPEENIAYDGFLLAGSTVRVRGRISFLLTIYREGKTLGVTTLEVPENELADCEQRIVQFVVEQIFQRKVPLRTFQRQRLSQHSYEELLLAKYFAGKQTPRDNEAAIEHYERVLEAYPENAAALSGMAATEFQLYRYGVYGAERVAAIEARVERALTAEPENVQAHTVKALLAMYLHKDFYAAGISFQNALTLGRDYVDILKDYVWFLMAIGQDTAAIAAIEKALTYSPLSPGLICTQADLYRYQAAYGTALKLYEKAREYAPDFSRSLEGIAFCLAWLKNETAAWAALDAYTVSEKNHFFGYRLTCEVAQAFDDRLLWEQSLGRLLAYQQQHPEVDLSSDLMTVYAHYDADLAMEHLYRAFENGVGLASIIRYPVLEPLRKRADYQELIGTLQLDLDLSAIADSASTLLHLKSELNESLTVARGFFVYARAEGNYCYIYYLHGGQLKKRVLRLKMKALQEQLPGEDFRRIHRSYLVNLNQPQIELVGNARKADLLLQRFDLRLPVARSAYAGLK